MPPLSVGEVVEAEIVESARYGKALILMKNSPVMVYSGLPLKKGEKIAVRVAQLHPRVVLHVVQNEISQKPRLMDYLRFYRSNPKALSEFFMEGIDRFNHEKLGELAGRFEKEDVRNIQNILKSLIFSRESLKSPLFFRDYIYKFGYLMEKELRETLKRRSGGTTDAPQNLKELLLRVSGRLQSLMEIENLPAAEKLAGFVRSSLQTIESHQAVNYLFQEYEGKYIFQIPLLFPENMGLAEIYVKFGDQEGKGRRKEKSVLFLLNMDVLGDIVVEAKIKTRKIGCVLKCGNENVCDFIRPFLQELGDRFMALGYEIDYLKCVTEKDNLKIKNEHREFQNLFALESVDILA
ncbi:MAG: hypothetical protein JRC90_09670 [Deltaproteobacteria bacterium]|nr:hypothetical protein [Deltaproteobacteria bacterium]